MTTPIKPNFTRIPQPMRERPQWLVWKFGKRLGNGKRAKVPFSALTGQHASTADPATWSTFEQAMQVYQSGGYVGIGYVFNASDPFTFVDLDDCIRNDTLDPGAMATIRQFSSYTERSVSGTGVHIVVVGEAATRKNEQAEIYSNHQFLAMTGDIVAQMDVISERQAILDAWHAETFPPNEDQPQTHKPTKPAGDVPASDTALLDIIQSSKQGPKFNALWNGDTAGYKSPSQADMALCDILAFWTGKDATRMDSLFRQSSLMRAKWDRTGDAATERTYGQLTIDNACSRVNATYRPSQSTPVEQLCNAYRAHFAGIVMHPATQRVLLAALRKFENADKQTTPISSRNISDVTGLSHTATQKHMRLLCPQTRKARMKRLHADTNRVDAQLRAAANATTAEDMLLTLRPFEREKILRKCGAQGDAAIMAEVIIFSNARRDRAMNELKFYASHPTLDIFDCNEANDGDAFANVYTLRTRQIVSTLDLPTVGGGCPPNSEYVLCGNNLPGSVAELQFIEDNMNDDAFVVNPRQKLDPRLKLIDDPAKRARVAKLLNVDAKLKPFGLSAPQIFAYLDVFPGATYESIMADTQLSERTIRNVLKAAGAALVEGGYLPLVEVTKDGRKSTYSLAADWKERLDNLRPNLATNGLVVARAVYHAGERIQRINAFLENNKRDAHHKLDDVTRAQYEAIKQRAQLLQVRLQTGKTAQIKPEAMAISNDLVVIEAKLVKPLLLFSGLSFADAWQQFSLLREQMPIKMGKGADGFYIEQRPYTMNSPISIS